jgi:hypothetical protein
MRSVFGITVHDRYGRLEAVNFQLPTIVLNRSVERRFPCLAKAPVLSRSNAVRIMVIVANRRYSVEPYDYQ